MKIAMLSGSLPPDACGVGDFAWSLAASLNRAGIYVEFLEKSRGSSLSKVLDTRSSVYANGFDLLHIQYPTRGYGSSLAPQLLATAVPPSITTIHEYTQAHKLRKASLHVFAIVSRRLIFTNDFERQAFARSAPWAKHKTAVIPIGNSLKIHRFGKQSITGGTNVLCFGLIRPNKGIESAIELARIFKRAGSTMQVVIAGKREDRFKDYSDSLLEASRDLPISWRVDPPDTELEEVFSAASFAYLPYPDGASDRRTSLLATMQFGIPTFSTVGPQTTRELGNLIIPVEGPAEVHKFLSERGSTVHDRERIERARQFAHRYDWDVIAQQHIEVYSDVLANRSQAPRVTPD